MHIWITGASSGIGAELAQQYAKAGHTVFASARAADTLNAMAASAQSLSGRIIALPLDVTQNDTVLSAFDQIKQHNGPLDLVILNAGYYQPVEFNELTLEHFEKTYDVNLLGVVRCLLPTLQYFSSAKRGHIAIVSSVSGYRGLPKAAAYGSSKAALINMAESLKPECNAHSIKLSLINPGFVKSTLTDQNKFEMPAIMETSDAATRIINGLETSAFELSFPKRFTYWLKLLRILPYKLYFVVTKKLVT
ncbi:UNVERIFIED_CONTAM: hypothetical protein GTU68_012191 [Idotea baltica]|nr:hypothetical protein [Idotea baltica]